MACNVVNIMFPAISSVNTVVWFQQSNWPWFYQMCFLSVSIMLTSFAFLVFTCRWHVITAYFVWKRLNKARAAHTVSHVQLLLNLFFCKFHKLNINFKSKLRYGTLTVVSSTLCKMKSPLTVWSQRERTVVQSQRRWCGLRSDGIHFFPSHSQ